VTFSFPDFTDPSKPNHTTISIPSGSGWAPGAHWHESYTEHVQIKKGRAEVTIGDVTRTYGPEDGVLTFPKCTIHNFGRADGGKAPAAGGDEGDVEVEEWTDLGKSHSPITQHTLTQQRLQSCFRTRDLGWTTAQFLDY
jgi:hypothetical protein